MNGSNGTGPFVDVLLPPLSLLKLVSFSKHERAHISANPQLAANIDGSPPAKWPIIWEGTFAVKRPRQRQPQHSVSVNEDYRCQALADLDAECVRITALADGRHEAPFHAACRLGKYVAHGCLSAEELDNAVVNACAKNGALQKYGLRDIGAQIANGLRKSSTDELPPLARKFRSAEPISRAPRAGNGDASEPEPELTNWPELDPIAYHGMAREFVELATLRSEADPAAVLFTFVTSFAATAGRQAFFMVGDSPHHARLFTAIAGASAKARKGTSADPIKALLNQVYSKPGTAGVLQVSPGPLSSGEGLLYAIRDAGDEIDSETGLPVDPGVDDKRLLILDGEFGGALKAATRSSNTLTVTLRGLWDGVALAPLTKFNRTKVTDPHVCVVTHITIPELKVLLAKNDLFNGFVNRFLWALARRTTMVPLPEPMPADKLEKIAGEFGAAVVFANSGVRRMDLTQSARDHWSERYADISKSVGGVLGSVTSRSEAQVLRLAMTFALLDRSVDIKAEHLEAAEACWNYSFASARNIFQPEQIDPTYAKVISALKAGPLGLTELRAALSNHVKADRLSTVLEDLQGQGRLTMRTEKQPKKRGRPRTIIELTKHN